MNETNYFVHHTAVVDEPVDIGEGTRIWHFSHIMKGARIGAKCSLGQNVFVGSRVVIGNNCKIQNNVSIYDLVTLENDVFCGPSCVFTNDMNPRAAYPKGGVWIPTLVKKGTSIGANATIMCGITLGRYSFIGAGAVIRKDVPDYALMVGVPGRQIGWMCECGKRLKFDDSDTVTCTARCKGTYKLENGKVRRVK
ncbi:N-acetyltransferase, partial [candidate division WOR-3 bacterium]|nr:N-acetyltransferase [candidate division WOR-3 bacterium]